MSSRLSAISLVAAALSLTACSPAVKVSIYNNTPDPITVVWLRGQALMIPSHSPLTLSFPPVLGSFSVVRGGVRRDYAIHYPGKEFMLKMGSLGNVKGQTLRAFRRNEMEGILAKIK